MHVRHFSEPSQFAAAAEAFLLAREAENNLMLGLFAQLADGRREGKGDPALYVVYDDSGAVVGAALWAGYQLIFSRSTPEGYAELADYLASHGMRYPKASGPASEISAFALADLGRTGMPHAPGPVMRLMQAKVVVEPSRPAGGYARIATADDLAVATQWSDAFTNELNMAARDRAARILKTIQERQVLLWCDPEPVSMAIVVGETKHGARIGSVYTPPERRRRGYASACVAELGKRLIGQGREFVYLYAEATNKTSNHIYESLGFEPVCDWQEFDLDPQTA